MTLPACKYGEYLSTIELILGIRAEVLQAEQRIRRPHIRGNAMRLFIEPTSVWKP